MAIAIPVSIFGTSHWIGNVPVFLAVLKKIGAIAPSQNISPSSRQLIGLTVLIRTVKCLHDGSNRPRSEYQSAGALEPLSHLPKGT